MKWNRRRILQAATVAPWLTPGSQVPPQSASGTVRPGPAFPFEPGLQHDRDFPPTGGLTQLSPDFFVLRDTCNVYILRHGDRAVLVDFGSGEVMRRLPTLGVKAVDKVLVTHHHRDQVQGLCDLPEIPFEVIVPAAERHFFENVEAFWKGVKIHINYDCRSHWNTIRQSIRVDRGVAAGDSIPWVDGAFLVVSTPGVTDGSVSFVRVVDGRKLAFTGDLIAGAGRVNNWFDLHWDYYGFTQGTKASLQAFENLEAEKVERLLPSHGDPIDHPSPAMDANRRIYAELSTMLIPNELHRQQHQVRQILPHLYYIGMNCYGIVSDSGNAFLWDYGYVNREMLAEFKEKSGVSRVEAASFSHYHDDHCIRAYELLWENSELWVYENMADLFCYPNRYRLPCLVPFPIIPDRVLHDGEKVRWQEYELDFFHLPGQTDFHQGLSATIDGRKVLFTGDNTWNKLHPEATRNGPLVPHNEYFLDGGFITCAQKMLDCQPDLVCPAHTEEYSPTRDDLVEFLGWARQLRTVMTGLVAQPDPNFGVDYRWCHFYPYRTEWAAGSVPARLELRLRNHLFRNAEVRVRLKVPDGLSCAPAELDFTVKGKEQVMATFSLTPESGLQPGRKVVTADLTINECRIGEYAEALVDVG